MNRHQRRAARARERSQEVGRTVAIHEAGHVVGRILVAESLGWSPDEMVSHIDIESNPLDTGATSFDGTHGLKSQAVTFGQMFSQPMSDFIQQKMADRLAAHDTEPVRQAELIPVIAEMRVAGIDVDRWYRAMSIVFMLGPMAEAKLIGKSFEEVWNSYGSESDLSDAVRYGLMCGMTPEQIEAAAAENAHIAEQAMAMPSTWAAILAVAGKLKFGRTPGGVAARIAVRELGRNRLEI
jgi:hypothetical protein